MAPYNQEWDEDVPIGSVTPANTIDDIFIALKEALGERLAQAIVGFRDDSIEPKISRILYGPHEDRPEESLGVGHLYISLDDRKFSFGKADKTWEEIDIPTPTEIPAALLVEQFQLSDAGVVTEREVAKIIYARHQGGVSADGDALLFISGFMGKHFGPDWKDEVEFGVAKATFVKGHGTGPFPGSSNRSLRVARAQVKEVTVNQDNGNLTVLLTVFKLGTDSGTQYTHNPDSVSGNTVIGYPTDSFVNVTIDVELVFFKLEE